MVDGVNGEEKGGGDSIRCGMLPETTNIACRLFPRGCNCATHWTVPAAAHALHQRNESFRRKSRIASLRSMTELVSISISLSLFLSNGQPSRDLEIYFRPFRGEKRLLDARSFFEKLIFASTFIVLNAIIRGTRDCLVCLFKYLKNNGFVCKGFITIKLCANFFV